jgi:AhpD family alkylhydroperoxidase
VSQLPLIDPATAPAPAAELLAQVRRSLGVIPNMNMTKAMANSPALLGGYVGLSGALARGVLDPATRERIALTVAQGNECDYCLSAHSYLAEHVAHLSADDIAAARKANAPDAKTAAILTLAGAVNDGGDTPAGVVDAARAAGVTDEEIAEVIGHVALNVLTNYFNKTIGVDIDFPVVNA